MINYIKIPILLATFAATLLLMGSCGDTQNREDTKDLAEEHNQEKFDNSNQKDDAQFLVNASEINMQQIQLGQLAQQKGRTTEVKELGKMMEDTHTKSQRELSALAGRKTITIPTSPTNDSKDVHTKLSEKSGNNFDKAYADMMVKENRNAISTFENAAQDANDRDIRNWATTKLQDMRTHLNHSIECQRKFAEMSLEERKN